MLEKNQRKPAVAIPIHSRQIFSKLPDMMTAILFGEKVSKKGWNFVEKMIRLAKEKGALRVVDDQFVSPTFTRSLADKIYELTLDKASGVFHLTASGSCSWYQFTQKILELAQVDCELTPVSSGEFPALARRPKFSVLENKQLKNEGYKPLPEWQEGLSEYLARQNYQVRK